MAQINRCTALLFILMVTPSSPLLGAGSDTVNERIPVRQSELETHWRVDCAASWRKLVSIVASTHCEPPSDLQQQLQLCAYIYQPPGGTTAKYCPDYRGAIIQLQTPGRGDLCPRLASLIQGQQNCPSFQMP